MGGTANRILLPLVGLGAATGGGAIGGGLGLGLRAASTGLGLIDRAARSRDRKAALAGDMADARRRQRLDELRVETRLAETERGRGRALAAVANRPGGALAKRRIAGAVESEAGRERALDLARLDAAQAAGRNRISALRRRRARAGEDAARGALGGFVEFGGVLDRQFG